MKKLAVLLMIPALAMVMAAALLGVMVPAASADDKQFSAWSAPVNLGPPVNSPYYDACPTISKNGLSLYFRSDRPGGYGGYDIWVSQRDSLEDPWEEPKNLGPTINSPSGEFCTAFSADGHWMIFVSNRPGGSGGQDLWISHRKNKRDDFGWETPRNLGPTVNSPANESGPALFDDEATGQTLLYFNSGFPGPSGNHIYVSTAVSGEKDAFGPPSLVAELTSEANDFQPVLRRDGLEVIFASNRTGGYGLGDLWVSTRSSTLDPWSPPVNLGPLVNSAGEEFRPTLSSDGTTLIFAHSDQVIPLGDADLYMCTRTKLRDQD